MGGEEAAALAALNPVLRDILKEVKAMRSDVAEMLKLVEEAKEPGATATT